MAILIDDILTPSARLSKAGHPLRPMPLLCLDDLNQAIRLLKLQYEGRQKNEWKEPLPND